MWRLQDLESNVRYPTGRPQKRSDRFPPIPDVPEPIASNDRFRSLPDKRSARDMGHPREPRAWTADPPTRSPGARRSGQTSGWSM